MDYKQSGVDIDAGNEVVRRIRSLARATFTPGVLSEIGSFGGLFRLADAGVDDPVLVASADGVGTKLRVAFMTGVHKRLASTWSTIASTTSSSRARSRSSFSITSRPAGWIQTSQSRSSRVWRRPAGQTAARCSAAKPRRCQASTPTVSTTSPALSSASSRGKSLIDGKSIAPGDVLVGIPSSGLHTNGYSLARRIAFETARLAVDAVMPELGHSIGAALLAPHRSYLLSRASAHRHRPRSRAWRTSPAAASPTTCRGSCPTARTRASTVRLAASAALHVAAEDWWRARRDMLRTFNMGDRPDRGVRDATARLS